MIPLKAYQARGRGNRSRIDVLLEVYDRSFEALQQAQAALSAGDAGAARVPLAKAQAAWTAMAAGVDLRHGEVALNLARLYEFVAHCAGDGTPDRIRAAVDVLTTLREGLEGIRPQAMQMERTGAIPSLDSERLVETTA